MHECDPGYVVEPFRSLCAEYPDTSVYSVADFRVEWGPIFHRGRLDGSARLLVVGQDPATHEAVTRRILVGVAGQRIQGFLGKLGIDRSYVMINTFLFSVYGQKGGERHRHDGAMAHYRNLWINAIVASSPIDAVISLGSLADDAWAAWKATPTGAASTLRHVKITHPTQPESSSGNDRAKLAAATGALLANWNQGLQALAPLPQPDVPRPLALFGTGFAPGDLVPIPEADLPPGLPAWMRGASPWAVRGDDPNKATSRRRLTITVP